VDADGLQQVGFAAAVLVAFVRVVEAVHRDRAQETERLLAMLEKALDYDGRRTVKEDEP